MGGMPGTVTKGRFFSRIDAIMNHKKNGAYVLREQTLAGLQAGAELHVLLRELAAQAPLGSGDVELSADDYEHARRDWFDQATGWWKDQETAKIVRRGFIDALQTAGTLPIDTWWLCPGDKVEVHCCRSPVQLTVLLMTPSKYTTEGSGFTVEGKHRTTLATSEIKDSAGTIKPGFQVESGGDPDTVVTVSVLRSAI